MAKEIKKAEIALIDADKFPLESFRALFARKYGLDAVALSGPCEGQPLVDCVVNQMKKRWDRIKDRFAGTQTKINKLAIKLAESYMRKDDTEKCEKDIQALGYSKEASNGISSYLKAYAMDLMADHDMNNAMDSVDAAPADPIGGDDMGMDMGGDAAPAPAAELQAPMGDEMPGDDMGGVAPADDMGGGMDTVTIELPMDVARQVSEAVEKAQGGGGLGLEGEEPGLDSGFGGDDMGMSGEDPGLDLEVVDMDGGGDPTPGGDVHGEGDIVPGEPASGSDDHVVEGVEEETAGGMGMGGGHDAGKCKACGHSTASEGHMGKEKGIIETLLEGVQELGSHEEKHESGEQSGPSHDKAEDKSIEKVDKGVDDFKSENKEDRGSDKPDFGHKEDSEPEEKKEEAFAKAAALKTKMASLNMRSGHIRSQRSVVAESILKLGPEMSINNTDQLGGHDDKKLGDAKYKTPDEPKPIADGNVALEGYSAGDKKYQDGKTMGREEAFDAKPFDKGSATGGKSSIMGKDESFPEGKPQVPAGSAPIGGEVWTGGDLATKGTVIATITPKGVVVEANGKKFLAKAAIKQEMVEKVAAGLSKLVFEGDGRKYAEAAFKVIKQAEESGKVDGVTKIDTGKLEDSTFTNDGEKKPEEGGAMTGKGGRGGDCQNKDITTTDTSKKEDEHFTNDGEKKADDESKKAAAAKSVKVAKPVEEPKPIADGNLETEGYSAGDKKFQDGKTMGHEEKFDAKPVDMSQVSGGEKSLMGKDEELPKGKPDVPAGGGKMGQEEWDGGDVSTKGTVIAENQSSKRQVNAEPEAKNDYAIREARLKTASVYVADLLRHNEIRDDEYVKELEKVSAMSVPAIQNLIAQAKLLRSRVAAASAVHTAEKSEGKVAGMSIPYVVTASKNETSLKDRLVAEFKLTKSLDQIDEMKR